MGKKGYRMKLSKKQLKEYKKELVVQRRGFQAQADRVAVKIEKIKGKIKEA